MIDFRGTYESKQYKFLCFFYFPLHIKSSTAGRSVKLSQLCLLGHEIMQHSLNNEFVKDVAVSLKKYKAGKTHIKKYYHTHTIP